MSRVCYTLLAGLFLGLIGNTHCRSAARPDSLAELREGRSPPALVQAKIRAHLERPEGDLQPPGEGTYENLFVDEGQPLLSPSPSVPERPRSKGRRFWDAVRTGVTAPFGAARSGWNRLRNRIQRWREAWRARRAKTQAGNAVQFFLEGLTKGVSQVKRVHQKLKSALKRDASPTSKEVTDLQASLQSARDWVILLMDEKENLEKQHPESALEIRRAVDTASKVLVSTADVLPLSE
ncbi:hypothetical protein CSUI_004527 [Cystoisospora suis]|uniref:Transmembrane protein n=1 Tax=Cystoisospora suis TaxID=483139 RepID=A0A2C6L0J7_9APIC|nr:hypothetical protein CSUI_004527 [Cystoisospora suis]